MSQCTKLKNQYASLEKQYEAEKLKNTKSEAEKNECYKILNQSNTNEQDMKKQISEYKKSIDIEEKRALECRNLQKGYIYTPKIGCHKVISWNKKNWTDAQKDCLGDGKNTDLAIFNSNDEAEIISERLGVNKDYITPYAWIGVRVNADTKMWQTVHGKLLSSTGYTIAKDISLYGNFIKENFCMSQYCSPSEIGLFKEFCTENLYYICEHHYSN